VPVLGRRSRGRLENVHPDLVRVLEEAIKSYDFAVIWGHRGMEDQNTAFSSGNSKNRWPTSKHNGLPSTAVDIVPYPGGYEASYEEFFEMATHVLGAASRLGVKVKWGGHWVNYTGKGHYDRDWAHFEIM
jgi:hypothetical protein